MTTEEEWGESDRLQALKETIQKTEALEREWKHWRAQSKTLTIELITLHGYTVSKAATMSGHHRNTIKVWLDLYNAENKQAQRAAAAGGRPGEKLTRSGPPESPTHSREITPL
jgi:hypothetical protein